MARYSTTTDGRPSCPVCAAYGVETVTRGPVAFEAWVGIDVGDTEPLVGVPCGSCAVIPPPDYD